MSSGVIEQSDARFIPGGQSKAKKKIPNAIVNSILSRNAALRPARATIRTKTLEQDLREEEAKHLTFKPQINPKSAAICAAEPSFEHRMEKNVEQWLSRKERRDQMKVRSEERTVTFRPAITVKAAQMEATDPVHERLYADAQESKMRQELARQQKASLIDGSTRKLFQPEIHPTPADIERRVEARRKGARESVGDHLYSDALNRARRQRERELAEQKAADDRVNAPKMAPHSQQLQRKINRRTLQLAFHAILPVGSTWMGYRDWRITWAGAGMPTTADSIRTCTLPLDPGLTLHSEHEATHLGGMSSRQQTNSPATLPPAAQYSFSGEDYAHSFATDSTLHRTSSQESSASVQEALSDPCLAVWHALISTARATRRQSQVADAVSSAQFVDFCDAALGVPLNPGRKPRSVARGNPWRPLQDSSQDGNSSARSVQRQSSRISLGNTSTVGRSSCRTEALSALECLPTVQLQQLCGVFARVLIWEVQKVQQAVHKQKTAAGNVDTSVQLDEIVFDWLEEARLMETEEKQRRQQLQSSRDLSTSYGGGAIGERDDCSSVSSTRSQYGIGTAPTGHAASIRSPASPRANGGAGGSPRPPASPVEWDMQRLSLGDKASLGFTASAGSSATGISGPKRLIRKGHGIMSPEQEAGTVRMTAYAQDGTGRDQPEAARIPSAASMTPPPVPGVPIHSRHLDAVNAMYSRASRVQAKLEEARNEQAAAEQRACLPEKVQQAVAAGHAPNETSEKPGIGARRRQSQRFGGMSPREWLQQRTLKAEAQMARIRQEQEEREMAECTFTPQTCRSRASSCASGSGSATDTPSGPKVAEDGVPVMHANLWDRAGSIAEDEPGSYDDVGTQRKTPRLSRSTFGVSPVFNTGASAASMTQSPTKANPRLGSPASGISSPKAPTRPAGYDAAVARLRKAKEKHEADRATDKQRTLRSFLDDSREEVAAASQATAVPIHNHTAYLSHGTTRSVSIDGDHNTSRLSGHSGHDTSHSQSPVSQASGNGATGGSPPAPHRSTAADAATNKQAHTPGVSHGADHLTPSPARRPDLSTGRTFQELMQDADAVLQESFQDPRLQPHVLPRPTTPPTLPRFTPHASPATGIKTPSAPTQTAASPPSDIRSQAAALADADTPPSPGQRSVQDGLSEHSQSPETEQPSEMHSDADSYDDDADDVGEVLSSAHSDEHYGLSPIASVSPEQSCSSGSAEFERTVVPAVSESSPHSPPLPHDSGLRYGRPSPTSASKRSLASSKVPKILDVRVTMPDSTVQVLRLKQTDQVDTAADAFIQTFELDPGLRGALIRLLEAEMRKVGFTS